MQYSEPPWVEDGGSVGGEVWGLKDMVGHVGVGRGGGSIVSCRDEGNSQ